MPILVLVFIALPILELLVIIEVAGVIGVAPTIALLFATAIAGAILVRSQGREAWRRFNLALAEGRIPARETFDGAMVILGGALLVTPGFLTDVAGISLLLPPGRGLLRRALAGLAGRRIALSWRVARPGSRRPGPETAHPPPPTHGRYDYEGTAREVTDPEGELPRAEDER